MPGSAAGAGHAQPAQGRGMDYPQSRPRAALPRGEYVQRRCEPAAHLLHRRDRRLATVGYVQAAGLLMGPFLVVFMGISIVTVPEATRILRNSPHNFRRYCLLDWRSHDERVCAVGDCASDHYPQWAGGPAARPAPVAARLSTSHSVHDHGHGVMCHPRRTGGIARARCRPPQPALDGPRVGPLSRFRCRRCLRRWRGRHGLWHGPRNLDRRDPVVGAAADRHQGGKAQSLHSHQRGRPSPPLETCPASAKKHVRCRIREG